MVALIAVVAVFFKEDIFYPRVLTSDGEVITAAYRRDDVPAGGPDNFGGCL